MSHFSVLVVGDVAEQLRNFQENNMGDCPKDLMEFKDKTEELTENYNTDKGDFFVSPDGEIVSKWDHRFDNPKWDFFNEEDRYLCPEGWEAKSLLMKDAMTFDEYAGEYCGYRFDPEKKAYGYWENPNAKWDWYEVGGRYRGRLMVKGSDKPCDTALVKDLDFEAMAKRRATRLKESWDAAHVEYPDSASSRGLVYGIKSGMTEDQYVNGGMFTVFAAVENKTWHESGEMGWWGVTSNEKDPDVWAKQLKALLDSLSPDDVVSVVDCHI